MACLISRYTNWCYRDYTKQPTWFPKHTINADLSICPSLFTLQPLRTCVCVFLHFRDVFSWKFIIQTVFKALTVYNQFTTTMLVDIVPEFSLNRLSGPQAIKILWAFQTPLNPLIHTLRFMLKFKTIGRTELRQYWAIKVRVSTKPKGLQVIPETGTNSDIILCENLGISSDIILYNNLGISLPRQCTSRQLR